MSLPYAEAMAMCLTVTYTLYATSSKEQTGDVITFAQFEEGSLLTETRNDTESDDVHRVFSTIVSLRFSVIKFFSSNCAKIITSPICSLEDVAYGVYVTVERISIASAYGRDMYDNALKKTFVKHNIVRLN